MTEKLLWQRQLAAFDQDVRGHGEFRPYTLRQLDSIPQLRKLPVEMLFGMRVVANVLPFRVNQYVLDQLIDWSRVPDDPIFQLVFPQPGMLEREDFEAIAALLRGNADAGTLNEAVWKIRRKLNPHPSGQQTLNVPELDGAPIEGLQHKYRETLLLFPAQGQSCHAYCTFCFRWAQFVGDPKLRFASREAVSMRRYLSAHPEITDVLITGGDPAVMNTANLAAYIEPLLAPEYDHIRSIRLGTKALAYWPYRFTRDKDADDFLRLIEKVVAAGKQFAFMAHFNHWRELEPAPVAEAIDRLRSAGAVIRSQSPVIAHINDDSAVWARMWQSQVELGIHPYYMFVERDTGAKSYFEIPLHRACDIYRHAISQVSGLARSAHGPVMSATPGKIEILGTPVLHGEKVFVLRFIQARNPDWVGRLFFARWDTEATWFDDLEPAFGKQRFFFEEALQGQAA
jgi:KamA family protein